MRNKYGLGSFLLRISLDLCFIDADKANYPNYYECALQLVKKNGIIAIDNTLYFGKFILPPEDQRTADAKGIQAVNEKLASDPRVDIVLRIHRRTVKQYFLWL